MRCCEGCGRDTPDDPYCVRCVGRQAHLSEAGTRRCRRPATERSRWDEDGEDRSNDDVYHGDTWRDDL